MKKILILISFIIMTLMVYGQEEISGRVTSSDDGSPLPGVNILVQGTTAGTITNLNGEYEISVPEGSIVVFSYVGYESMEIQLSSGQSSLDVVLQISMKALEEIVFVGYGTQRKSDITGAVTSVPRERLEQVPVVNFAQAIQGAIPGVTISTNTAGAEQDDLSIMVRGRNSIAANNTPLVVLDGIPYSGSVSEINPDDIESIEILRDASASAIYGSRGSNGVILISTKKGKTGKPVINYSGFYGIQKIANMPDFLDGPEFHEFKNIRDSASMTPSEEAIYQNGEWTDWIDASTQVGHKQQHTLSVSGGTENINYFVSGTILDVEGVAVNDLFKRYSARINIEAKIASWLKIGSNTQLSLADRSGETASWAGGEDGAYLLNPLTAKYDTNGNLTINPWPEDPYWGNPLGPTLYDSKDKSYKVISNNYVTIDMPFAPGLQYKLNTGVGYVNREKNEYRGMDTKFGSAVQGQADTRNRVDNNYVIENILTYVKEFKKQNVFVTGLYSYQTDRWEEHRLLSSGFTNDVLTWHQAVSGNLIEPSSDYQREDLVSQMLRVNYSFDRRYLLTVTGRRDGFSGFGSNRKWGFFPSVAMGWNIGDEGFFSGIRFMNQLKLRASYGQNGNQAVGPYETLARVSERSYLFGTQTAPGYIPSKLGNPDLGWETSTTLNAGIDFAFFTNKVSGSIEVYNTDTRDLLLDRKISSIHGITSVTQNIGETNNKGLELAVLAYPVSKSNFTWNIAGTFSLNKNKIVSLYGELDDEGKEIDDILNGWFIGEPIRVNFDRVIDGTWQLGDDIANSAQPTAQPGYARVRDANADSVIDSDDRIIQGQLDPKTLWSLTNTLKYKDFTLTFFIYGATGATKQNSFKIDNVWAKVRVNTTRKNWWTPKNPTNEFYANNEDAHREGGVYFENASFARLKDISLSYDLPVNFLSKIGFSKLRIYIAGRNLVTITDFGGLDPELREVILGAREYELMDVPLEREYLIGLIFGF